jgi:hypothetical protein
MSDTTTSDEAWFYAQGGQRKGPVPADKLRELVAAQTIDGEMAVWRKGLADWQPLRTVTDRGAYLQDTPPAIAANHVNNGLVWALACAPSAYLFLDVALLGYQNSHPAGDTFFETFLSPLTLVALHLVGGGGGDPLAIPAPHEGRHVVPLKFDEGGEGIFTGHVEIGL